MSRILENLKTLVVVLAVGGALAPQLAMVYASVFNDHTAGRSEPLHVVQTRHPAADANHGTPPPHSLSGPAS